MYFSVPHVAIRMGMFGIDLEWVNAVKIADFDSAGRGNRFPVGRNRVPSVNFQKLAKIYVGTGSQWGRNRVPIHFSRGVIFELCGNRFLHREELGSTETF